ncbi:MAG: hypothetical protein L3K19_03115 [Thermoplasmata archaeon]|nr:hypothetical protein [Thermoplasmata archaeon]
MTRIRRSTWAFPAFGLVLALVLIAPVASAGPPLFKAVAPYTTYGGFAFTGSLVLAASGSGSNVLAISPSFNPTTGVAHQSQQSTSSGGGAHKIQAWSGVQNVSFSCPATCTSGNHSVIILWNVTWAVVLNTTCVASPTHLSTFAGARIALYGYVTDVSVSPQVTVGHGTHQIYQHVLQNKGLVVAGTTGLYLVVFIAGLTAGHSYAVTTFVQATTLAASKSGCASSASALIGSPVGSAAGPTTLVYIKVV